MKTKDFKVSNKSSDLTPVLYDFFGKSLNLARIKFISLLILFTLQGANFRVWKKLHVGLKTTATQILHYEEFSDLWLNTRYRQRFDCKVYFCASASQTTIYNYNWRNKLEV